MWINTNTQQHGWHSLQTQPIPPQNTDMNPVYDSNLIEQIMIDSFMSMVGLMEFNFFGYFYLQGCQMSVDVLTVGFHPIGAKFRHNMYFWSTPRSIFEISEFSNFDRIFRLKK